MNCKISEVSTESTKTDNTRSVPSFVGAISPMGIHGDNPGAQITTIKLDGTNYLEWSQSAKMYIGGRSKLGYINGRVLEPADLNFQAYTKWESENLTMMSWLLNSM